MSSPETPGTSSATTDGGSAREPERWGQELEESIASQARIAPRRHAAGDPHPDPRPGGDASKAPTSLTAQELDPIEASSGVSWDDPDEL
ncbi:hypothetical protein [Isoptericola cucumis]|uniref:Uncharacterized protein n=1 Tax=Isoptericola cucumis TaxID=1776856 RepID=A0ABQ2B9K0_9MICO|nr:hypothetical protein [Isoptericola cucumis]GGI11281.1 hypothetical protein GCM10007368_35420 [Isoptericola cucumis]